MAPMGTKQARIAWYPEPRKAGPSLAEAALVPEASLSLVCVGDRKEKAAVFYLACCVTLILKARDCYSPYQC